MKEKLKNIIGKIYQKGSFAEMMRIGVRFGVAFPVLLVLSCMFFDVLPDWGGKLDIGGFWWCLVIIALFEMVQWAVFDRLTVMKALGIGGLSLLLVIIYYNYSDVQQAFEIASCKEDANRDDRAECRAFFEQQHKLYSKY